MQIQALLLPAVILFIALHYGNSHWHSPRVALFSRWLNWGLCALLPAHLMVLLGFSQKPFELLVMICFLGWFLLESMYTWVWIRLLSFSTLTMFPLYQVTKDGGYWPNQKRFIQIKRWIREQQFAEKQLLRAVFHKAMKVRSVVYEDPGAKTRLQVLFFPSRRGGVPVYFSFYSKTKAGKYIVTDNIKVPYGGYYPIYWRLDRKPLIRSPQKLFKHHKRRLEVMGEEGVAWEGSVIDEMNEQQRQLALANSKQGFLQPKYLHESAGKLSFDGRYRLWKEAWLLKYFGKTVK